MNQLHKDFPYGCGMWIWYISKTEGGNIAAIIDKCKRYNISYVLVKSGDGRNTWGQFTKELVDQFHAAGIKIYSWTYLYGQDPQREANIAMWSLDMGVDGHVFDAEAEYRDLPNNADAARIMLTAVRDHAPKAFLAHSPLVFPENHPGFPYDVFGKYCDAVMPQAYWGTIYKSSVVDKAKVMVADLYNSWSAWEKKMKDQGKTDSIKPIIPAGQTYDNPQTGYTLNPSDIKQFVDGVFGYMSVNFWSWQAMVRNDCWDMVRDVAVKAPPPPPITASEQSAQVVQPPAEQPAQTVVVPPPAAVIPPTKTPEASPSESPQDSGSPFRPQGAAETSPVVPKVDTVSPGSNVIEIGTNNTQKLTPNTPVSVPVTPDKETTIKVSQQPDGTTITKVTFSKKHIDLITALFLAIAKFLRIKGVK